ncbi:Uncharacterised protein [uncultured archaeon]|nr:Uncharacterised protein [uncultured archaeon]
MGWCDGKTGSVFGICDGIDALDSCFFCIRSVRIRHVQHIDHFRCAERCTGRQRLGWLHSEPRQRQHMGHQLRNRQQELPGFLRHNRHCQQPFWRSAFLRHAFDFSFTVRFGRAVFDSTRCDRRRPFRSEQERDLDGGGACHNLHPGHDFNYWRKYP